MLKTPKGSGTEWLGAELFYEFSTAPDARAALSDEKIPLKMKGERNFEVFIAEDGWRMESSFKENRRKL